MRHLIRRWDPRCIRSRSEWERGWRACADSLGMAAGVRSNKCVFYGHCVSSMNGFPADSIAGPLCNDLLKTDFERVLVPIMSLLI